MMEMIKYSSKEQLSWQEPLFQILQNNAIDNDFWSEYLSLNLRNNKINIHLGIFVEPYLQLVLDEKKTLESRFSINRTAPYNKVSKGDILLLKQSGGHIVGICQISEAWSYVIDPKLWEDIKENFHKALCIQGPEFWERKKSSNYATLMILKNVLSIKDSINFVKSDRRGWIVLKSRDFDNTLNLF